MKIKKISLSEAEEEFSKQRRRGAWTQLLEQVKSEGSPVKVSDLSRGQIAALCRRAKELGIKYKANYSEGYVILAP